jgi:transposase-like protein
VVESDDMLKFKRENARLQMENEILKKAAAFFAKDQLKGLRS